MSEEGVSRREWLKAAGVGVVGLAVGYGLGYYTAPEKVREVQVPAEGLPGIPDKPLKIGYMYFMTGTLGTYGTNAAAALEMAVEEINNAGGILGRRIELTSKDEADREHVLDNLTKMVQEEGAEFLVGIDSSGDALKMISTVEEELQVPFIVTHAATPKLTECGKRKYIFRISMYEEPIDILAAQIVAERYPDVVRIANIGPDYAYGYDSWAIFSTKLKEYLPDVELLEPIYVPLFTTDYSTYIDQIIASGADLLFSSLWGGDAATFFKQGVQKGLFNQIRVYMNAMLGATDTLEAIGNENVPTGGADIWGSGRYWFLYPPHDVYPLNKNFVEKFRSRTGGYPPYVAATSYTAIYALKEAIELAYISKGSWPEVDDIIAALEGLSVAGPMGWVYIRPEDHQGLYDVFWGRLAKGTPNYPIPILTDLVVKPASQVVPKPFETIVSCG